MINPADNIPPESDNLNSPESSITEEVSENPPLSSQEQIKLKQEGDFVYLFLPLQKANDNHQWLRMVEDFKTRLQKMDKSWLPDTKAHLESHDKLLDTRQIRELDEILEQNQLKLDLVVTQRRQTAVAAASAGYSVKQNPSISLFVKPKENPQQNLTEPLYIKTNLRSGVQIAHDSTVIVLGDVNPGATIVAGGDVFVWGTLKGIAHAGARGNRESLIMALKMNPTQLRIADLVARAPDDNPDNNVAEVAYIGEEGIRIRDADTFRKLNVFDKQKQYWQNRHSELRFERTENLTIEN
ncbi:septum site-determining protein MinC [Cyanobacterium stanieri LEGE 03274]|uniref:Probable septum site-determining protein MinC n=1 Tax=Cyanobacterium stanieri LEGE 03274 TaxID=1828756 RepID=A0ABR9V2G4_9CHRO|nr:septum site-determining protein MinC [Cyanobacterium stanieri]MBE9222078.1 septum site-determining protein MinC [Cyanobacterium stanieri LEGE 03274]